MVGEHYHLTTAARTRFNWYETGGHVRITTNEGEVMVPFADLLEFMGDAARRGFLVQIERARRIIEGATPRQLLGIELPRGCEGCRSFRADAGDPYATGGACSSVGCVRDYWWFDEWEGGAAALRGALAAARTCPDYEALEGE